MLMGFLGDEFKNHFEEADDDKGLADLSELCSYLSVVTRQRRARFSEHYLAKAKEINLTGLIVDPAIESLGKPYNRYIYYIPVGL